MNEENLMCPVCGGLHPAGHRDKELEQKLEAVKKHLADHPNPDKGACDDCPYPLERKNREGACGACAIGTVKHWLEDHEKILEAEG